MDVAVAKHVEALRRDYRNVTGTAFQHFFCPILRVDEEGELCQGHITPKSFGVSNRWLPQRKDVDNFYGTAVEAEWGHAVRAVQMRPDEILYDRFLSPVVRPRIECDGKTIKHFFPSAKDAKRYAEPDQNGERRIGLKIAGKQAMELEGRNVQMVVDKDFRPAVTAGVLKAAYLAFFDMFGYEYCFSASGQYVGDILKDFFLEGQSLTGEDLTAVLNRHFSRHGNMIRPFHNSIGIRGTAQDSHVLAVYSQSRGAYAMGVIVNSGKEMFVAFLPGEADAIDIYFDFLRDPPPSLATRLVKFVDATDEKIAHWEGPGQSARFDLPGNH